MKSIFSVLLSLALIVQPAIFASAATSGNSAPAQKVYKQEEIEQLVAPIALYPDALLAQVLMASTYTMEVVLAARFAKANSNLKGQELEIALGKESWDPSVKSLIAFPQVLQMMNDKIVWTGDLGNVFLAQQADVMQAIQNLRAKANAAGNLKSSKEQKVTTTNTTSGTTVIQIEPANPEVIYVPTYNPTVVYGAWPYPAYQPAAWYPAGYVATGIISFGLGLAVGSALWGGCNWNNRDVNINVNKFNNFNRNNQFNQANISNNKWEHNSEHRRGVPYNNSNLQNKYSNREATNSASREAFRGRADNIQKGQDSFDRNNLANRDRVQNRPEAIDNLNRADGNRGSIDRQNRDFDRNNLDRGNTQRRDVGQHRDSAGQRHDNAFSGASNANRSRVESARGSQSRQIANSGGHNIQRSGGGGGGVSRGGGGGGGGARSGGGRR